MAGSKDKFFKEKLSNYIMVQLKELEQNYGLNSEKYNALKMQYIKLPEENKILENDRDRHYQSDVNVIYNGNFLRGVERLYKRTILIEPSSVCAAHCRWCLRGQYPLFTLREEEITNFAKYCGSPEVATDVKEILITGGDPFMVPHRLKFIIAEIKKYAENIQIVRIGTRIPLQDPGRINKDLLSILEDIHPLKLEIGTHINHPVELSDQALSAFKKLFDVSSVIYDQTVLLKGVNDRFEILSELYDKLRYIGIESHYLFHCVPMRGMTHHRTSVKKGLELISKLTSSGYFSGRSKPMYTLMTDIGKITLYEGSILEKNINDELLIQSYYTAEDFIKRNPSWKRPHSVITDEKGFLRVWYPDGNDY